jgi:hypothetical protein
VLKDSLDHSKDKNAIKLPEVVKIFNHQVTNQTGEVNVDDVKRITTFLDREVKRYNQKTEGWFDRLLSFFGLKKAVEVRNANLIEKATNRFDLNKIGAIEIMEDFLGSKIKLTDDSIPFKDSLNMKYLILRGLIEQKFPNFLDNDQIIPDFQLIGVKEDQLPYDKPLSFIITEPPQENQFSKRDYQNYNGVSVSFEKIPVDKSSIKKLKNLDNSIAREFKMHSMHEEISDIEKQSQMHVNLTFNDHELSPEEQLKVKKFMLENYGQMDSHQLKRVVGYPTEAVNSAMSNNIAFNVKVTDLPFELEHRKGNIDVVFSPKKSEIK